jgi:hypothetical protein
MAGHLRFLRTFLLTGITKETAMRLIHLVVGKDVSQHPTPWLVSVDTIPLRDANGSSHYALKLTYPRMPLMNSFMDLIMSADMARSLGGEGFRLAPTEPAEDFTISQFYVVPIRCEEAFARSLMAQQDGVLDQMQASAMEDPPAPIPAPWHCPHCGTRMAMDPRQDINHDPYGVFCIQKSCNLYGTTLTAHHPIYGHQSAPGDSWSLSYIK